MTNEEFAELRARKKAAFERLMNPKGVPYLEMPPPPEPEPLETGEQGRLW